MSRSERASIIAEAQRTPRAAPVKSTWKPSPVVRISRPPNRSICARSRSLCASSRECHLASPTRSSVAVDPTMSVMRIVPSERTPVSSSVAPKTRALANSTASHGTSPTTQPSCPGGISYTSPAWISISLPSSTKTCRCPLTAAPRCRTWQVEVPIFGATSVDQRHPGLRIIRPTAVSSRSTTSIRPRPRSRVCSGAPKFFRCSRGTPVLCPPRLAQTAGEWSGRVSADAELAGHPCDDPDLDEETLARYRGLHRGARRPVVPEVGTVCVVERVEVGGRAQEDERVERIRERRPSLLEDRADVVEDAARLRRDVATARLICLRIERDLPGDEHEVAVADCLRVRQAGVRRPPGVDDLSLRHIRLRAL